MSDGPIPHDSADARVWARYWMRLHATHGDGMCDDEECMVGWFANAMAAAVDNQPQRPETEDLRRHDRDFVVLPREALFEFLGKMALPPWTDTDGTLIGSTIPCAPIAEELSAWVDTHDLSDIYLDAFAK